MLQFNLLRPEWTGIIKQNLSYDGEPVSSVIVAIRLRAGRQENMARFSTKIIFSLSHFLWANAVSCPMNIGSAFPRGQAHGCAFDYRRVLTAYYLQGEEAGNEDGLYSRTTVFTRMPCLKLSVPNNTHFHLSSIFKKGVPYPSPLSTHGYPMEHPRPLPRCHPWLQTSFYHTQSLQSLIEPPALSSASSL